MSDASPGLGSDSATPEQSAAVEASRVERDRTFEALLGLEAALGTAAPGREAEWISAVSATLRTLEDAMSKERTESLRLDSLLSMIATDNPRRFASRVRQLREQSDDIIESLESLHGQLDRFEQQSIDVADVRQRLGWVIRAIHYRRARESDLVFEAIRMHLGTAW